MRISDWSSDVCSSDLRRAGPCAQYVRGRRGRFPVDPGRSDGTCRSRTGPAHYPTADPATEGRSESVSAGHRSEEHTSELQSLMRISYAVLCLKKTMTN